VWVLGFTVLLGIASGTSQSQDKTAQSQAGANPTNPPVQVSVQDAALKDAAQKGIPMTVVSNVSDETSVEAVLIPASLARRIFGKEVANNYAVIELIVSNRDSKAALIVQSVFLDYSQWLLSGLSNNLPKAPSLEKTQKENQPWQVASVESRLVRGELLDAQQWTARNWTIRALTAIGSVAAGFQFPFSADVSKGIAAFNGVVVPGVSTLWPDGTVNQLNRISDVGFQTNKVIPKQASDIMVAFFPIDRFLTPTFRKMFLQNPAGFFVPGELINEPKTHEQISGLLLPMAQQLDSSINSENDLKAAVLKAFLECGSSETSSSQGKTGGNTSSASTQQQSPEEAKLCKIQQLFTRISLNSVRVVIGGVMTVDQSAVPATIYGVNFADGNTNPVIWNTTGVERDGTITGLYLSGGTPYVVDETGAPIDGIAIDSVADTSNDTQLAFKMTVSKCIPSSTKVFFVVAKQPDTTTTSGGGAKGQSSAASNKKAVTGLPSTPYQFPMQAYQCPTDSQGTANQGGSTSSSTPPTTPASAGQPKK
jgi:hypothetical protein